MKAADIAALITAITGLIAAIGALRHSQNTRKRVGRRPTGQQGAPK